MENSKRIEKFRIEYINSKPKICYERARIFTESHKETEGQAICIRRAKAFLDACNNLPINIFEDELLVGTAGKHRRTGILTPEFSWRWVEKEMDNFDKRTQDPYIMTDEQRGFVRKEVFPYWKGKSLEEVFLARVPEETGKILIDTGIIDNDSKWRQAVGEVTPDYQDILFKKGYKKIKEEAEAKIRELDISDPENIEKIDFYKSEAIVAEGLMNFAKRYSDMAKEMSEKETYPKRREELIKISQVCERVPAYPPSSFYEAIQFVWFVQLGGIISENPLALNLGRFDQYMYPYYEMDVNNENINEDEALELIEALWIKLSEWVWTISANTANYFAGYNQFQNLTVGGRKRNGTDATNTISYLCLKASKNVKTHQPGLSVRIHQSAPDDFVMEVARLVKEGTGFPAIHNDRAGAQMLLQDGYDPEDARDWSNCGCVVPHFRKTGQWTSAVNINFGAALEYAINEGKSRLTGEHIGLDEKNICDFDSFEEIKEAFFKQMAYLIRHSVIGTTVAQQIHKEIVPRPFLSICVDGCFEKGLDLSKGGAKYNIGPVLTGIGLGVVSNSLAAIKKLVFEEKIVSLKELSDALDNNWNGYEGIRKLAINAPKYGNDNNYVDELAIEISDFYYKEIRKYKDIFGSKFNSAFMGISNYVPTGKIIGATPCGRKSMKPLTEGVSPFAGTDTESPLAAMKSAAKINHDVHTGGTLLNLRFNQELLESERGLRNLTSMIKSYFALGAFHVQFNTISNEILLKAQEHPEEYKDLLVRVAGYSTQFVNLSKEMQDAIIVRNSYSSF
ncbi:formate C-acetyltransferase/glycerol dehydratase family glycyl radical enzyme [Romboutsia weinsteinii]|uniref:Formate C-acetyltransferase/glycerol dehydratase family glycyl radical enzyme n=1 Tax=Romboutsia weinsteinii TaxID=2020949 RepID=A0A371J2V9_9FIRM|nr:formate C-acetyltransferase/glycerol dehydratase family glycyl radical enzyme [Romboutsia weinsteinii]RDY26996.1 formate C-acetyltransferase/glycerol dehydratase family glycyl radical enzyme [Romboutsia weinsteinii]